MTTPAATTDAAVAAGASRWTVAIFALIGLGAGLLAFAFRTPNYEAEALVAVSNPIGSIADEVDVVLGDTVIGAASAALGFTPDLTVTVAEVANLVTITASDDDPQQAADAANVVASVYVQAQQGAAANIAQTAVVPDSATGLGPLVFAALGTLFGALVGALVGYAQVVRGPRRAEDQSTDGASALPAPSATPPPSFVSDPVPQQQVATMDTKSPDKNEPATFAKPSSFSDAATDAVIDFSPVKDPQFELKTGAWLTDAEPPGVARPASLALDTAPAGSALSDAIDVQGGAEREQLDDLGRRAVQSQFETARYELVLAHEQENAHLRAEHEKQAAELRAEIAELNKRVRMQAVRLKGRSGTDQTRVGDLEAQVDALEGELAGIRQTLETERIAHTKRLTDERGAADRALDNARRQYREELAKHVHTHRQTLAEHRSDLDHELAEDRSNHASALDSEHTEYERQLEAERQRAEAKLQAANERNEREVADLRATTQQELERQAVQHKETIESLRGSTVSTDVELREVSQENRALRVEITSLQKQARIEETDHTSVVQRLSDELAIMRTELEGERERNAALRADVLRRSAEAHQAIDRAVEERTVQLSELEASVARQREYADTRVREVSAASEEQSRQAAIREAGLTAQISRLKRELDAISPGKTFEV